MKTTKFLISLLLLFAMCLSLMSSAALAEEVGAGDEGGDETIVEEGSGESGEAPGEGGEGSGESGEGSGEGGEAPGEGERMRRVDYPQRCLRPAPFPMRRPACGRPDRWCRRPCMGRSW